MANKRAKDPAFLFYSSDFLTGVADLTMEERGQYITLLCLQHQKGRLSGKAVALAAASVSEDVLSKFKKDENGLYYSERLEIEIEKRAKHSQKQSDRAKEGWKKRRNNKNSGNAAAMPLENENENENISGNENTIESKEAPELKFPYDDQGFQMHWNHWKDYKKKEFKFSYKSQQSEQAALIKLSKLSGSSEEAIAVINQSMENGWKGFFKLREDASEKKSDDSYQQILRVAAKMAR